MIETTPPSTSKGWIIEGARHNYAVVGDDDVKGLVEKVEYLIVRGWVCQGGIATIYDIDSAGKKSIFFYQSMLKL